MLTVPEVEQLLYCELPWMKATKVERIGEGAWSTAFGFHGASSDRVIRIGRHEIDFRRDQAMSKLATAALPIPEVLAVGSVRTVGADDRLYYCVSTRAFGDPLETCSNDEWPTVAENLADALEAMRIWTPEMAAAVTDRVETLGWREQLLSIEREDLDLRSAGWRAKLATSKRGLDAFSLGLGRLREVDIGDVPLTLVHGDLINRNVHIGHGSITGIFDWGCQRWGDHLFDLAWFDFWSPWHRNLDVGVLRAALRERWSTVGYAPDREPERTRACLTYIGLDHLIYNAVIGRWSDLDDVVDRMKALDLI